MEEASISQQLQELLDRQEIIDLISRYSRSMDRLDADLGKSVFYPDATVDYGAAVFQGSAHDFVDWVLAAHRRLLAHSHQMSTISIRLDGDTAWSETYGHVTTRRVNESDELLDVTNLGRYIDRWARRGRRWAIIERQYVHDFDEMRVVVASQHPMTGTRDSSDVSYRGMFWDDRNAT